MFVVNTKNQQKESLLKRVEELVLANKKLAYQNTEKDKRTNELAAVKVELEQQNSCLNKAAIVSETDANFNITFVNDNFCELYGYHREELIGQNHRILNSQKQPDVFFSDMISTISSGKVFKGEVLNKQKGGQLYWMDITIMPFKDLNEKIFKYVAIMFDVNTQTTQKEVLLKQADQLVLANTELAFQNEEKEKRADELDIANKELAFQNEEKQKRAEELILANTELAFQNNEKEKRAEELDIANTELAFQNKEKEKRAEELVLANTELAFQNEEKEKRADELDIANTELAFQNKEKEKRADELDIANTELAFQNKEKEKRADELAIANTELAFQNKEKDNRADELILANKEKQKRANELILANKELAFQTELDVYRSEMERVAHDLTLLIDTANAPIFGIDSKGLVNEWNQTSEKITGFTKDEVLGKDLVQNYITEDYRESVKKVLDDALLGQETANYEFPLFAKDGQRVMVLLNSSTRRDAKGKITGVLGVGQDITELDGYRNELELKVNERTLKLNQALEKQKELNELKSRFVSTASHEFRTPLSSINFAAGSIKKYWAKMEPILVQKKLDKIEDQVLHMTKLLDDILIVGKAEAGKIIQHPIDINLGDFMSEIIDEVSNACEKSHDIELIDVEGLKTTDIFIDEKSGRNIFINLIGNAVKYSPTTKNITVVLSSEKEHTVITITDYGIGISKAELKTIFKPFSRGKNVDLIQGSGLGLTIVKEAIDAIGGKIIVNSTLGNGTSFIIKILKQQHV